MGTLIPPPFVPPPVPTGDPCINGWGPGKPFGDGPPPETIWIEFLGVEKGPNWVPGDGEPSNGLFQLLQVGAGGCNYVFGGFPEIKQVLFGADDFECRATNQSVHLFFRDENISYNNLIGENAIDDHFTGGEVKIIIPDTE